MKTRSVILIVIFLAVGITMGWLKKRHWQKDDLTMLGSSGLAVECQIQPLEVRPTGDHAQLILKGLFSPSGPVPIPIRLEPPTVSLLTSRQTVVPRFIGPLLPEPVLRSAEPTEVTLHYWLPLVDLKTPLILEVCGRKYPLSISTD